MRKIIALSGGFDPAHIGHARMIQEAVKYGDVLLIVNSDEWLKRKKGFVFMPWAERAEMLSYITGVTKVVSVDDADGSVVEALREHMPNAFGNGGDRVATNTPEVEFCQANSLELVWNLGGGKVQSSSDLVNKVRMFNHIIMRD